MARATGRRAAPGNADQRCHDGPSIGGPAGRPARPDGGDHRVRMGRRHRGRARLCCRLPGPWPAGRERITESSYVELQIGDENHHHGKRRYSKGHYLTDLTDAAIDAYLSRGAADGSGPDPSRLANGGLQAYGGAIADVGDDESAFSHRTRSSSSAARRRGWTRPRTSPGWRRPGPTGLRSSRSRAGST